MPACDAPGLPVNEPVELLNAAHDGLFWMENCSFPAPLALGVNVYALPAATTVAGAPWMTGLAGLSAVGLVGVDCSPDGESDELSKLQPERPAAKTAARMILVIM
jgi:hypothetical protein